MIPDTRCWISDVQFPLTFNESQRCFVIHSSLAAKPPPHHSGIVNVHRKFSRANPVLHVGADNLSMHRALLISAFLSRRLTALGSELPAPLTRLRLRA